MEWEVTFDDEVLHFLQDNWFAINNKAFRKMADDAVDEAKANIAPERSGLHVRSGKLRESIKLSKYVQLSPESQGTATIRAGNSKVPYAAIHEYGGVIKPKYAKYLRFRIGDKWFSKRAVKIPARPYLQPAVDSAIEKYDTYLREAMDEIQREI